MWAWELYQLGAIRNAQNKAQSAQSSTLRAELKVIDMLSQVEDRMNRMTLLSMAVWELVKERTDLCEDDLAEKVREIDLRDGQLDGRIRLNTIKECRGCGRVLNPRHERCLYCGEDRLEAAPFERSV